MADHNFSIFSNAEPKRDSYGFAVRPQHLQRYREYGHIYKEEEEERSEKWRSFLEQCALPADRCTSAGEHSKKSEDEERSEQKTEAVPEKFVEGDDSSRKSSISEGSTESRVGKEASVLRETKPRKIQTSWTPIRPSLALIEQMMSMRVKKKVSMKVDLIPPLQEHLPPIGEEISPGRSSEENFEDPLLNDEDSEGSPEVNVVDDSCRSAHTSNDSLQKNELLGISDQVAATNLSPKDAVLDSSCPENCKAYDDENGPNDFKERSTWKNIVTPERFFPVKEELESLVRGGVPKCIRGEVWQAFVGARARRVERYYQKLLSLEMDADNGKGVSGSGISGSSAETPEKWRKQIEKDLPRTFPGHPALDEEGRNSLRRILVAYARHNPSVGYCQAMNFFAGLLLLLMPEENAFWTLVGIIDDYFDGYYTQEMIESQVDQLVFEDLMRERFPKLVNHLDYLGVEVAWISGPWFLSIFVNMLPWESVLRVWDVIMFEGNRVMLFRTALALMEIYGPAMVTTRDAGDAATLLQSLAGSTFDSSQLVLAACMGFLAVTEDRLEELRNKHRPAVLGIIEERTKGTEVSKESKSLATKLYSFKHDSQSLIKVADTNGGVPTQPKSSPDNFDDFMSELNMYSEVDSLPDLQDQVVWYKVELCRLVEEKRLATLRAEELETAFLEMVKQDNRRQLAARVEQLEHEVAQLRQVLSDKEEQEKAMLQVLMRMEQEQKLTEEARIAAEQDAAAQRQAVHVLREKYEKAMTSVAEKEKRAVMAESMLEATIHYQSGQAKALSSPRALPSPQAGRKTGLLSFGLGWRDWNKGRSANVDDSAESRSLGKTNREQHQVRHSNTEDPAERNNSYEGTNSHHEQVN